MRCGYFSADLHRFPCRSSRGVQDATPVSSASSRFYAVALLSNCIVVITILGSFGWRYLIAALFLEQVLSFYMTDDIGLFGLKTATAQIELIRDIFSVCHGS